MKEVIHKCPICTKTVAFEVNGKKQKIESVNGICWSNIGYSIGGWGNRRDIIKDFSDEVCKDCFRALRTKINELKEVIEERRGSSDEWLYVNKSTFEVVTTKTGGVKAKIYKWMLKMLSFLIGKI